MKRLFALLLALCLCAGLCACGAAESEASPTQETTQPPETAGSEEELYEKSGVTEDGTVFTTWRRGGPEGTPAKLIYDTPDGTHYEEDYSYEGVKEYCVTTFPDGSSYENYFYPSGNLEKTIYKDADGALEELHFLDNGYIDADGLLTSGTVSYEKHITADGQVEELDYHLELMEDGTWWSNNEWEDGSTMRVHYNQNGYAIESYWDIPELSKHIVTLFYEDENETEKSVEITYDNSEEYELREYYEDGSLKHRHMINFGGLEGTEREDKISPLGYSTYMLLTHPSSGTEEWFADENGNLEKYVKNGTVYEGDAISSDVRQGWDSIKEKPEEK